MNNSAGNKIKKNVLKFKVGDLVKLKERRTDYAYPNGFDTPDTQDNIALVIEESRSWLTALEDEDGGVYNIWDIGTRYWDDVNFCPYRVQTLSGKILWASVNDMKLISPNDDND